MALDHAGVDERRAEQVDLIGHDSRLPPRTGPGVTIDQGRRTDRRRTAQTTEHVDVAEVARRQEPARPHRMLLRCPGRTTPAHERLIAIDAARKVPGGRAVVDDHDLFRARGRQQRVDEARERVADDQALRAADLTGTRAACTANPGRLARTGWTETSTPPGRSRRPHR